jgi:hypothetical protein
VGVKASPALGRAFTDEEGEIGSDQKVILSHGLWQQLYAGDSSILGRELRISGRPFTIVGVMPPNFAFIEPEVRVWMPLAFTAEDKTVHHSYSWYHIGRLRPGATVEQAQVQVNGLNDENLDRYPELKELLINTGFNTEVKPLGHADCWCQKNSLSAVGRRISCPSHRWTEHCQPRAGAACPASKGNRHARRIGSGLVERFSLRAWWAFPIQ